MFIGRKCARMDGMAGPVAMKERLQHASIRSHTGRCPTCDVIFRGALVLMRRCRSRRDERRCLGVRCGA